MFFKDISCNYLYQFNLTKNVLRFFLLVAHYLNAN